jgi:hypothetical protein
MPQDNSESSGLPNIDTRDMMQFNQPNRLKANCDVTIRLLNKWAETTANSDLIVISFGSRDDGDIDASQQREPNFVKMARESGKRVSVLNIDIFDTIINENGQSSLGYLFFKLNHPLFKQYNDAKLQVMRTFLTEKLKNTPVVLADYCDARGFKDLKAILGNEIDVNHPNLTLICGYGAKLPVALSKKNIEVPDSINYVDNEQGSGPSSGSYSLHEVQALNPDTTIFMNLAQVELSDIRSQKPLLDPESSEAIPKEQPSKNASSNTLSSEFKEHLRRINPEDDKDTKKLGPS